MRRRVLALVAAGLLFAGCGTERSDDSPAAAPGSSGSLAPAPDAGGVPAALQFSAPSVGGGEIDFARSAGRPVVLWFWAPT